MKLRMVWLGLAVASSALVACGDDSGDGSGGSGGGSTTGASTTATTTGSTTAASTSTGDGGGTTSSTGEGAGTSSSSGDGGAGGGAGGGAAYDCDSYCTSIMGACTDANLQYPDEASCLASCAGFPVGEFEEAANSLGCRAYHSSVAESDAATHCGHAGPLGDDLCGEPCEGFCAVALEVCGDEFASESACLKVCEGFTVGEYSIPAEGDTLGCRMYHLSVAAQTPNNTALHCPHIAADSDVCVD